MRTVRIWAILAIVAATATPSSICRARQWHQSDAGVAYFEYHLDRIDENDPGPVENQGPTTACQLQGEVATVVGPIQCPGNSLVSFVSIEQGQTRGSTFSWLRGVFAMPPSTSSAPGAKGFPADTARGRTL